MTKMFTLATANASSALHNGFATLIDATIALFYKVNEPGATVIVTSNGATMFRKAYGMATIANQEAMTPEATMRLGSITKQFTAVSILMLIEEGKLSLTDKLVEFFADYPKQGSQITVEHLLTHTSGIVSYTDKEEFDANIAAELSVAEVIDSFKNDPLEFAPGTDFKYNNSGYYLLGALIEKISGLAYAKFVEQRIFLPLDMNCSYYEGYELSLQRAAAGHTYCDGSFVPCDPMSISQAYAAGALVSNVDDLARWENAIVSGKLISAANWTKAFSPHRLADGSSCPYGYGWEIGTLQQRPMLAHGGGINGFQTFALRLPKDQLFVAVLSNADFGIVDPGYIAHKIAAIAIGKPIQDFKEIKLDADVLDAYVGVYTVNALEQRTFWRDVDQLLMLRTGGDITPVHPYSDNEFFIKNTLVHMEFVRDTTGTVAKVVLHQNGEVNENLRVAA
jgi:D-alanyl-D-alanine carboxypeptidase